MGCNASKKNEKNPNDIHTGQKNNETTQQVQGNLNNNNSKPNDTNKKHVDEDWMEMVKYENLKEEPLDVNNNHFSKNNFPEITIHTKEEIRGT